MKIFRRLAQQLAHPLGEPVHTGPCVFDTENGWTPTYRQLKCGLGYKIIRGHVLFCKCGLWQFFADSDEHARVQLHQ